MFWIECWADSIGSLGLTTIQYTQKSCETVLRALNLQQLCRIPGRLVYTFALNPCFVAVVRIPPGVLCSDFVLAEVVRLQALLIFENCADEQHLLYAEFFLIFTPDHVKRTPPTGCVHPKLSEAGLRRQIIQLVRTTHLASLLLPQCFFRMHF